MAAITIDWKIGNDRRCKVVLAISWTVDSSESGFVEMHNLALKFSGLDHESGPL